MYIYTTLTCSREYTWLYIITMCMGTLYKGRDCVRLQSKWLENKCKRCACSCPRGLDYIHFIRCYEPNREREKKKGSKAPFFYIYISGEINAPCRKKDASSSTEVKGRTSYGGGCI